MRFFELGVIYVDKKSIVIILVFIEFLSFDELVVVVEDLVVLCVFVVNKGLEIKWEDC